MKINIEPYFYNRTATKDGIHHEVQPEKYYGYYLVITENYYNYDDKNKVIKRIIKDLRELANELEELNIQKTRSRKNEKF